MEREEGATDSSVLYVAPLRIVAPEGICKPSLEVQEATSRDPLNGLPPDFLQFRIRADQSMLPHKPKSSAIRDYPDGCTPRAKREHTAAALSQASHELKKPRLSRQEEPEPPAPLGVGASQKKPDRPEKAELKETEHGDYELPTINSFPFTRKKKRGGCIIMSKLKASTRPLIARKTTTVGLSPAAARKIITETLRLFDAVRRNLLLEDEPKGSRPDLNAGKVLSSHGLSLNRSAKRVGVIPGLEVGDMFYFRMELSCAGMHGPIQAGIDYLNAKETKYGAPVAISIISSGGYDAKDEGDELTYTGSGGKSGLDCKPNDQKLERGNLAMKGSMKYEIPVRVIRGVKDATSPSGKTYTYDGLYRVDNFWSEKGKSGFEEFKFKLQRLPDQPELGSSLIKLSDLLKHQPSLRKGMQTADISGGEEAGHVCVVNTVDDEAGPAPFKYSTTLQYPRGSSHFGLSEKCACKNLCNSSKSCSCLSRNDNVFAYVNGLLVKERGVVYECGKSCKCSNNCVNKATQKSTKFRFEVFKTQDRGWGLRCQDIIPAGTFVCEYTGQVIDDLHSLQNKDYILDSNMVPFCNPRWGDVSGLLDKQESAKAGSGIPRPGFTIDSSKTGNMARFINHSCSPNLLVQCVFRDEQDIRWPHAMLFAMDNIPPFRELTMDYGTSASTLEAQLQGKVCECKSVDCRGRFGY